MGNSAITTLFLDVGGVLLTNGWDHVARLVDKFVLSCFVHYRKPDFDIYRIALDISQANPKQVAYIDDRPLYVEVGNRIGILGILHTDVPTTRSKLAELGLTS